MTSIWMAMRPPRALFLALLIAGIGLGGCAAKTTADLLQAEQVLLAARQAGAADAAPYQLALAQTYLDKAREEWGDSQYEDANALAAAAIAHAEEAERLAIQEATMGEGAQEVVPEELEPLQDQVAPDATEEPLDDELMELIQDDQEPATGDRPSILQDDKIDEEQFEVDE